AAGDNQVVRIDLLGLPRHAFKDAGWVQALELESRLVLLMCGHNFDLLGVRDESTDDQAGTVAPRVHAQKLGRRSTLDLHQTPQFFNTQNHSLTFHAFSKPELAFEKRKFSGHPGV